MIITRTVKMITINQNPWNSNEKHYSVSLTPDEDKFFILDDEEMNGVVFIAKDLNAFKILKAKFQQMILSIDLFIEKEKNENID